MFDDYVATEAAKKKESIISKVKAWFSRTLQWIGDKLKEAAGKVRDLFNDLKSKISELYEKVKNAIDEAAAIRHQKQAEVLVANTKAQLEKARAAHSRAATNLSNVTLNNMRRKGVAEESLTATESFTAWCEAVEV